MVAIPGFYEKLLPFAGRFGVEQEEGRHALDSMPGPAIRSWRLGVS